MKLTKKNYYLWKKAKRLIPGGNMILSKRPELILPVYWPTYYKKAKGIEIWDLDKKKYLDFSLMGVGTNILGYSYKSINDKVKNSIDNGNMSSLNCLEELNLTRELLNINKWAGMVKYARSGGEANAIAVRIARAASGKDDVAVCGYHGWHDWYLSANLKKKNQIEKYLLSGLQTSGVPKYLSNSVHTFRFNDFEGLKKLLKNNSKIGILKMEVSRNFEPNKLFLRKVRSLCTKNKIILIFDECTSGFRETYGGIHKKYNVNPDIVIYGKALGNGHAITAIIGKKVIMRHAKNTFISSTFWSERSGFVAALETLKVMKSQKTWLTISRKGQKIKKKWGEIFKKYNYDVEISGLKSIPSFIFLKKNKERTTFISQEMLKKGIMCGSLLYVSVAHKDNLIDNYLKQFEKVVSQMKKIENKKIDLKKKLLGPIKSESFKRLN